MKFISHDEELDMLFDVLSLRGYVSQNEIEDTQKMEYIDFDLVCDAVDKSLKSSW